MIHDLAPPPHWSGETLKENANFMKKFKSEALKLIEVEEGRTSLGLP